MRGVSAIIAIILILMIVVALAALTYTWFTGIFISTTNTTGEAIERTTTSFKGRLLIENINPKGIITLRNSGLIPLSNFKFYANDEEVLSDNRELNPGEILNLKIALPENTYNFFVTSDHAESFRKIEKIDNGLYQEHAEETDCSDECCDGDWNTEGTVARPERINYSVPANAIGAEWQVKCASNNNYTIPSNCWNDTKIILEVFSSPGIGCDINCWNFVTSTFVPITSTFANTGLYEEAIFWITE
ncbi:MAG: hypothetical protein GTN36_02625 [Candidatus Aenigmarchaeota archaeon]|nr:hypothetical protein [Candidatus Aenigmarchaeota archaeon]